MTILENENTGAYSKFVNFSKLSSRRTSFCTERFVLSYKTDVEVSLFGGEPTYLSPNLLMVSLWMFYFGVIFSACFVILLS